MNILSRLCVVPLVACAVPTPESPPDPQELSEATHLEGILAACTDVAACASSLLDQDLIQTTCEQTVLEEVSDGCTFDPLAAEMCQDALRSLTCDPNTGALEGDISACAHVYVEDTGTSCTGLPRISESVYLAGMLASCATAADCAGNIPGVSAEDVRSACEDAVRDRSYLDCSYDPAAAAACLSEAAALACDTETGVLVGDVASCDDVFSAAEGLPCTGIQ